MNNKKEIRTRIKLQPLYSLDANWTKICNTMFKYIPNGNNFKIYCYLCYRFNRDFDYSFPSIQTIVKDTGLSKSTVTRGIKWLEEQRFIKKYKKEGSEWMNNCYFIKYVVEELEEVESDEEIIIEEWEDDDDWEIVEISEVEYDNNEK